MTDQPLTPEQQAVAQAAVEQAGALQPQKLSPEEAEAHRQVIVEQSQQSFNPSAFDAVLKKFAVAAGQPAPTLRRAEIEIEIGVDLCHPGTHDAPFKLTLRAPTQDDEFKVYLSLGLQPDEKGTIAINTFGSDAMAVAMAKAAIHAYNGRPLDDFEKDFLWATLTMGGRWAIGKVFMDEGAGFDAEAVGKAMGSVVAK